MINSEDLTHTCKNQLRVSLNNLCVVQIMEFINDALKLLRQTFIVNM